jgi:hypothetical protein
MRWHEHRESKRKKSIIAKKEDKQTEENEENPRI